MISTTSGFMLRSLSGGGQKSEPPVGVPAARAWGSEGKQPEDQFLVGLQRAFCGKSLPVPLNRIKIMQSTRPEMTIAASARSGLRTLPSGPPLTMPSMGFPPAAVTRPPGSFGPVPIASTSVRVRGGTG